MFSPSAGSHYAKYLHSEKHKSRCEQAHQFVLFLNVHHILSFISVMGGHPYRSKSSLLSFTATILLVQSVSYPDISTISNASVQSSTLDKIKLC